MRLLIDESIPEQIEPYLAEFDPSADQSLRFQQNLGRIGIGAVAIVNIRNRMKDILPVLPRIKTAVASVGPGEVIEVLPR
ncbi:MAG TPA: hypothetical protein VGF28_17225 [Thermoanaerobaculia bacterium]